VSALDPQRPDGARVLGGGGALAVDVKALGKELRRLWEETAVAPKGGARGGTPVLTRSCTRNLVVLANDLEEAARAAEVIAAVADRHPTRAFIVRAAEGPGDDPDCLKAYLEARCMLRGGVQHVCCEQITLEVGAQARRRAAGTIVPLLVPDLPVFVWVMGDVAWDDELLTRLLAVADRLVVDSRRAKDVGALLTDLAADRREGRWAPGDFEWSRLAPWREAVAAQFDEPHTARMAPLLDRVRVRMGHGGSPVAAALLSSWAVDRLGRARDLSATGLAGRAEDGDGTGDDAPPRAELEATDKGAPGAITELRFTCDRPEAMAEVIVAIADSALTAWVDVPEACALPSRHPMTELSEECLLEDQLDSPGAQPVYERALLLAATLLAGATPD
jgi:glucose-6-phosphate dehydrogenase assembly protein OpcA